MQTQTCKIPRSDVCVSNMQIMDFWHIVLEICGLFLFQDLLSYKKNYRQQTGHELKKN